MEPLAPLEVGSAVWRLAVTLFFVLLNGAFVAAEFSLVKVRGVRIGSLAEAGSGRAGVVRHMLGRLDLYLSACQLGVTASSLVLGWLAEPAVARLLVTAADALGWTIAADSALHAVALALALTIVTVLHMTLGEQAPKIWAIHRAERTALQVAYPLRIFTWVFAPLIWGVNLLSNGLLHLAGISPSGEHEASLNAEDLRAVLAASAQAGYISPRQREFAENILSFVALQVRHILVPRVDAVILSTSRSVEENLATVRDSRHSRFPLCDGDLDATVGMIHAKDVLAAVTEGVSVDLKTLVREPVFVPDTQPLARMIVELQRAHAKAAIVLDDHGTAIGLAFLEDALEEIVGPIQDEFDEEEPPFRRTDPETIEVRGDLALPEAVELLGLDESGQDDTIGGHVTSLLKRIPREGDELTIGGYRVTVIEVSRRRVRRLRFEPLNEDEPEPS